MTQLLDRVAFTLDLDGTEVTGTVRTMQVNFNGKVELHVMLDGEPRMVSVLEERVRVIDGLEDATG